MTKEQARKKLALAASRQGLKVQMKSGKVKDAIRILNASGKVVAEGTLALDASKGYVNSDVQKTITQINTKLGKKRSMNSSRRRKMNCSSSKWGEWTKYFSSRLATQEETREFADGYDMPMDEIESCEVIVPKTAAEKKALRKYRDAVALYLVTYTDGDSVIYTKDADGYFDEEANVYDFQDAAYDILDLLNASRRTNSSKRRKMNSACSGKKKMNASDDEYIQDDAEFVEDVESVVTDEQGNEIVVEDMLVVQDPETNEISLFVPTEEDEAVPENVEVIGEVVTADDETTLDSSRKRVKTEASKRTRR